MGSKDVISCVVSARHRLKYLEKFYSTARAKFAQVPNMDIWERPTFDFLESVAMRIEEKHGRLSVTVVTKADYDKNKEFLLSRIEDGPHFRQSPEQDFAGLPDPFGSYRAKLNYKDFGPPTTLDSQISDRSQSLDHIQDPKMLSYTQREINRFREKEMHKHEVTSSVDVPKDKDSKEGSTIETEAETFEPVSDNDQANDEKKDSKDPKVDPKDQKDKKTASVMAKLADLRAN